MGPNAIAFDKYFVFSLRVCLIEADPNYLYFTHYTLMAIISLSNLTKTYMTYDRREGIVGSIKDLFHRDYREVMAVKSISFSVDEGELIGYIGPNGAGKSTSIKMLTGILKPTSGEMDVAGFHPFKDRKKYTNTIGVVFGQRTQLWWDIAVLESFKLLAKIYRVSNEDFTQRLDELTEVLNLQELLRLPIRKLSLGQRMRCDLAASLLHRPRILFLDEPTIGLDEVGKDAIRGFLRHINKTYGTTILLTTHDLKEIEELCKRIIVLDKGTIMYDGSLSAVKALPGLHRSLTVDFAGEAPLSELQETFAGRATFSQEGERRIVGSFVPKQISAADLIRGIVGSYDVADLTISEPGIEEVIMKIYRDGSVEGVVNG